MTARTVILHSSLLVLVIGAAFLFPSGVFSQAPGSGGGPVLLDSPTPGITNFYGFIQAALGTIVRIGIPISAVFIVYAGFLFLTAQGDTTQLAKAKSAFVWAAIGTAVLLGSWAISQGIKATIDTIGGTGTGTYTPPGSPAPFPGPGPGPGPSGPTTPPQPQPPPQDTSGCQFHGTSQLGQWWRFQSRRTDSPVGGGCFIGQPQCESACDSDLRSNGTTLVQGCQPSGVPCP